MPMKRKTVTAIVLSLLAATTLPVLLVGFVPQTEGPEVRRRVSPTIVQLRPEDLPPPIVAQTEQGRVWSIRQAISEVTVACNPEKNPRNTTPSMVVFDDDVIRLDMGGTSYVFARHSQMTDMAPLLALDGVNGPILTGAQPLAYGDKLDSEGHPLRWQQGAALVADYAPRSWRRHRPSLTEMAESTLPGLRLGPASRQAGSYREMVATYAGKYNLPVDLVYAIIHSESNFNPTLVSNQNATGLMQLLPSTASDEVHRFLYGRRGNVTNEELYDPETNIRFGTAYLHLLMTRYFQGVHDPLSREYCTVAAYNMGPNRFIRLYGKSIPEAAEAINAMNADELFLDLTDRLPVRETRLYVAKVRHMKERYAAMN